MNIVDRIISPNLFKGNSTSNSQYIGNYYIDSNSNYQRSSNDNFNCFRIEVIANQTYCVSRQDSNLGSISIFRYVDENYGLISGNATGFSYKQGIKTIPANCKYIEFSLGKTLSLDTICFNLSNPSINGKYFPYVMYKRYDMVDLIHTHNSIKRLKIGG